MSARLVFTTELISPYRIAGFNALAAVDGIDLLVIFLAENDTSLQVREWKVYKDEIRFDYEVLPSVRFPLFGRNVLLNWGMSSALARFRPDTVVLGGYNYPAFWVAKTWSRGHGARTLMSCESTHRDLRGGGLFVERLKRRFAAGHDGYVAHGTASREYLLRLGALPDRISIAPDAVDNDYYASRAAQARSAPDAVRARHKLPGRYFLYVGRLVKEKGVFDLLEAYAGLEPALREKTALVLAGSGPAKDELVRKAALIRPGSIIFPGFIHREEIADYYALADSLVFPTWSDPWGLVVNEAMACGTPVIASSAAGCADDLLEHEGNGLVVEPRDIEGLRRAMHRAVVDPDARRSWGGRARERVRLNSPEAWGRGFAEAAFRVLGRAAP